MTGKKFTPFPVLKTEKLTLRQLRSSDENEVFTLRSNDSVRKYLDRKPSKSINDARNFIKIINEIIQRNESVYWVITLAGNDKLIGTICLFNFSEDHLKAEIGYELLPGFQGKGIMQEAVAQVVHFGFQYIGLNLIKACTHSENQSSTRLLEKLNFRRDSVVDEIFAVYNLIRND